MVDLAVISSIYEYGYGIVLCSFKTVLIPSAKWLTTSEFAIQWHYAGSTSGPIETSDYVVDPRYHIWDIGGKPEPTIEVVSQARAFIH